MRKLRIALALLGQNPRVERCLRRKMLEQQRFRNGGSRRHALGRSAGKAMSGEATLGGTQDELPPEVAGHAQSAHLVSKHSPTVKVKDLCCGAAELAGGKQAKSA